MNINILAAIDQEALILWYEDHRSKHNHPEEITSDTPIVPIKHLFYPSEIDSYIKLICPDQYVFSKQGTATLEIKAHAGDRINWFEYPMGPDMTLQYGTCIEGMDTVNNQQWEKYVQKHGDDEFFDITLHEQVVITHYNNIVYNDYAKLQRVSIDILNSIDITSNVKLRYYLKTALVKKVEDEPRYVVVAYFTFDPEIVLLPN